LGICLLRVAAIFIPPPSHFVKKPAVALSWTDAMSKFAPAGSVNTPGYQSVGQQQPLPSIKAMGGSRPEPIGIKATDATVTTNRRWIIALVVITVVAIGFIAASFVLSVEEEPFKVREDSLTNLAMSKNVEIFMQNNDILDGGIVCSGVFIRETGEILTAAHCLYLQNPDSCNFLVTPTPHYPTTVEAMSVEIMGVNKTREKYTFPAQVLAWSGVTDIAIIKPLPLTKSDGSVISVVKQHHYNFATGDVERGDVLNAFGFDNGFFKKVHPLVLHLVFPRLTAPVVSPTAMVPSVTPAWTLVP